MPELVPGNKEHDCTLQYLSRIDVQIKDSWPVEEIPTSQKLFASLMLYFAGQ